MMKKTAGGGAHSFGCPVHPLGTKAKVLLTSVFGPYAQDDEYGSRRDNPMELFHNQIMRVQGPFSFRGFNPSYSLYMLQANIDAECTVLDFPVLDCFVDEIKNSSYDVVGIGSVMQNVKKVRKMCGLIRRYLPKAAIVVGGYISLMPGIHKLIDADYVIKGEGIAWFRRFLGQKQNTPLRHIVQHVGYGERVLGIDMSRIPQIKNSIVIPSLGCPVGCNFCATSAFFGGKGRFVSFYETGDELFSIMCQLEQKLRVSSFLILEENFLLHKKRALRLLELMEKHSRKWGLQVWSSARAVASYSIEQLLRMGISSVWIGLEGPGSSYSKLRGIDTRRLVKKLQSNGISVIASSMIGLENHAPENIEKAIRWSVAHNADLHQFMLYTPVPGTQLYGQYRKEGRILPEEECPVSDVHGQYVFNYRHRHIPGGRETEYLLKAFNEDFETNGPSVFRAIRTMLSGWKKYKNHPNPRIRERFKFESKRLGDLYAGVVWAAKKWHGKDGRKSGKTAQKNPAKAVSKKIDLVLQDLYREFGLKTRILALLTGNVLYFSMKREEKRLSKGWVYEPPTLYKKNSDWVVPKPLDKLN